jgi:S-formylglutathione hydrolase FrmB
MTTIATVHHASEALGRRVTFTVLLPELARGAPPRRWPLLYLLHGRSDDHRAWLERSTLPAQLYQLAQRGSPLAVVLPDGAISYWADVHPLMRYESYLIDDLDPFVRSTFPIAEGPAAIGGLSMGGFGALRLAFRHPARFASVTAHSTRAPTREELPAQPWAAGCDLDELDLEVIVARGASSAESAGARLPPIALDCGVDDRLLGDSRRVHACLERLGIAHDYEEHAGTHDWAYWEARLPAALAFHAAIATRVRA